MRRSAGIEILTTTCRRCGRPVATLSRSLIGADAAKVDLDRICSRCVTPEDERAILAAQTAAVGAWAAKGGAL